MHSGNKWVELSKQFACAFCASLLLLSFAGAQVQPPQQWQSDLLQDHSLVGRIWSAAEQDFISVDELSVNLLSARYLLLGEKHDNADHHALQLAVLNYLVDAGVVDSVSFEMMDETVRERLIDIQLQENLSLPELSAYLLWDEEGWDWDFYGPLVEAVYRAGIPLAAGNINQETVGLVYGDENAIDVTGILDDQAQVQLELDIDESHCGMLPASQFPAMVRVQQARDRQMARSLRPPAEGQIAVLVAGNYHVRQDLGVPNYLTAREPSMPREQVISLAFLEVQEDVLDPNLYQEQFSDRQAFDFIWFTPALTDSDYCASLR